MTTDNRDEGRRVKINHKTLCAAWVNHGWDGPVQLDPSKCNCGATDSEAGEVEIDAASRRADFKGLKKHLESRGINPEDSRLIVAVFDYAHNAATKRERERAADYRIECGHPRACLANDPLDGHEHCSWCTSEKRERERAAKIAENMDYIEPVDSGDYQSQQINIGNVIAAAIRGENR